MDAKELRLGNWVTEKAEVGKGEVCVYGLLNNRVMTHDIHNYPYNCEYKHIYPIKLSYDWLMKLGFSVDKGDEEMFFRFEVPLKDEEEHENLKYVFTSMCYLTSEDEWVGYLVGLWIEGGDSNLSESLNGGICLKQKIESVHELQNLYFSLTGEELTIKTEQPV